MVKDVEKQMLENGLDFSKFYSMRLQIPIGSQVEVKIDGKKVELSDKILDVKNVRIGSNNSTLSDCTTTLGDNLDASIKALSPEIKADVLSLVSKIHADGYVKNSHLWRRWVTAQTFKMLNYNGGWDAYVRQHFTWNYCFRQMSDEFYAQLQMLNDKDDIEFKLRRHFFNRETAVELLRNYHRQLVKKFRNNKILRHLSHAVADDKINYFKTLAEKAEKTVTTEGLCNLMMDAHEHYIRLPKGTPLCSAWKNAYRGAGAYYTLKNLIMWHGVSLHFVENSTLVAVKGTPVNLAKLNACLEDFGKDHWKFHIVLKNTIEAEHFNLKQSIIEHQ